MPNYGQELQLAVYGNPQPPEDQRLPFAVEEWEQRARAALAAGPFGYLAGGAGAGDTKRANREAFYNWRIWPRMLRDVGERDLRTEILGTTLPAPFLLAPIGVLGIAHPDGERAPARAAAATGIPLILSTVSSVPMEEVAAVMGAAPHWFQLYPGTNRDVMSSMVRRAEAAGYSAVVVTLDTTMLGWREVDLQQAYLPFLQGQGLANYFSDPAFRAALPKPPEEDPRSAILYFLSIFVNPRFSWPDIDFLRQQTRLPIVLKGILHPADAALALDHGVDGIIVSNHGGRQVDGATAALDALPLVAEAVAGRGPVLMDSGIRRAADVLKARALGATAVLLGRPYAYALAAAGEAGVRQVIRNLLAELDLELALSGRRSMAEVDRSLLDPLAPETDSRPT
jgi:lactate 2-monooxygenase